MSEETEILDAEIRKKFEKADKDEFVISGKFRLRVKTPQGTTKPEVEVLDLEKVSDGPKPLKYLEPEVLKAVKDHFAFTSVDTNPFMTDDPEGSDVDRNPFMS